MNSLETWTSAPKPDESRKSILLKSMTDDWGSFLMLLAINVLNCFSEKASNCPLKEKTIIFVFNSILPLKETVSFWNSSMIYTSKKIIYQM